ncbi:hypothetical protein ACRE_070400 [Hapsidospora chrysogenum ATCC 11550]|uniref:Chromo domain-containing protein n=1 Tax=Hapsidospora chrysogenum (strain ATCC 11550 / CBS 779.69 / DSM 880 / IAM 14645 / JCM 23072 / IMI 49137) TaxID=857340 RepID=A0A086SYQ3_HAPC1|nr:hypothetical protein ACRE_070400 [Hapsidospora chrysogenum ATCC 11550]
MDTDGDNLSTSSTLSECENSDEEYSTEGIIAEGSINGETRYLVSWTGYPLHKATWEPADHLTDAIIHSWEEQKRKVSQGEAKRFKIRHWKEATVQALREKHHRHIRRNALRVSTGQQPTVWETPFKERLQRIENYYPNDEDTSSEDEEVDFHRLDNPTRPRLPETGVGSVTSFPVEPAADPAVEAGRQAGGQNPNTERPAGRTTPDASKTPSEEPSSAKSSTPSKAASSSATGGAGLAKRQSAKTSAKPSQAAVNVFSGGTEPRRRKSLPQQGQDSSTEPKIVRLRYQRLMEKSSRDKENSAPVQMPKKLISLDPYAPGPVVTNPQEPSPQASNEQQDNLVGEPMDIETAEPAPTRKSSLKHPVVASSAGAAHTSQPLQRRKSVRWNDNSQVLTFEKMDGFEVSPEPGLFVPNEGELPLQADEEEKPPLTRFPSWRAPSPPRGYSPQQQQSQPSLAPGLAAQSVQKLCLLGSQASRPVGLLFRDIPPSQSWVDDFRSRDRLVFSHACTAQDFRDQFRRGQTQYPDLACGSVSAPTDQGTLETVADRLKLDAKGILCHGAEYCILLFPSKSEEWDFEAVRMPRPNGGSGPMNYIIFGPSTFGKADLATDGSRSDRASWERCLPKSLGQLLNLDYEKVFPLSMQKDKKHHIFFAFPPTAVEEARLLSTWLGVASKERECIIYDGYCPGDWSRFVNVGKGALIIHEDALWKLRLFPRMADVLGHANFTVSIFHRGRGTSSSIGDIGLRRLHLNRKVFLMTPSFVLSEPQKARFFINFFIKARESGGPVHLAVPGNIEDWLTELLSERCQRPAQKNPDVHREDLTALAKLVHRIGVLAENSSDDDDLSPLIFAPTRIDGSDEQSLVNWFGWWTLANIGRCGFGRFYVLGSTPEPSDAMARKLMPLRYMPNTVNDPDEALALLEKGMGMAETSPQSKEDAKLALVDNDNPRALRDHLKRVQQELERMGSPLWLNYNPVLYVDHDMAFRLGDVRGEFFHFNQWFRSMHPLEDVQRRREAGRAPTKNTLTGFFYTPKMGWESASRRGVSRDPWLAFFRPVNPHLTWRSTELFIWDSRYAGKYRDWQEAYEEDLDQVHRQFIEVVAAENARKNPERPLEKVWLGGWEPPRPSRSTNPVDTTLDFLDKVAEDVRRLLPAPDIGIQSRGWKLLKPGGKPQGEPMDVAKDMAKDVATGEIAKSETSEEDGSDDDGDGAKGPKMLFLPPRRRPQRDTDKRLQSLCRNRLYVHSMAAVKRGEGHLPMTYKYTPTNMWYGQQVHEGRDFKHMTVDTWKVVFDQIHLGPITE